MHTKMSKHEKQVEKHLESNYFAKNRRNYRNSKKFLEISDKLH